jgi:hypothetical protein
MTEVAAEFDGGGSVQWRQQRWTAFSGVQQRSTAMAMDYDKVIMRQRWPAQREDERAVQ